MNAQERHVSLGACKVVDNTDQHGEDTLGDQLQDTGVVESSFHEPINNSVVNHSPIAGEFSGELKDGGAALLPAFGLLATQSTV